MRTRIMLASLTGLLLVAGCAREPAPPALVLEPASFATLDGWAGDGHAEALAAFRRSCPRLSSDRAAEAWARLGVGRAALATACAAAASVPPGDAPAARAFFETHFAPVLATNNGEAQGLFTGYYEPEVHGAARRGGRYQVPLYRPPENLVNIDLGAFRAEWKGEQIVGQVTGDKVVPVPARAEVDRGAFAGKGLELLWVDSAVDAFFLHVQGSGRVVMDDGRTVRVGYAAKNGRPYYAIGRELIRRGALPPDQVSMRSIRAWLAAHPGEAAGVMALNPSYVFFREIDGDGPVGAQNVVLSAERSVAVDPAFIALGAPLWLETTDPAGATFRRLVIAQDTGGAVKGPVRGDIYFGSGAAAGARAGSMRAPGRYYLLLPKPPLATQAAS